MFAIVTGMSKIVIFDFDGTIADSFELFIATLQNLLGRPEPLPPQEIQRLRGLSIKEFLFELGIKPWQLPGFVIRGRRDVSKHFEDVNIFPVMSDLTDRLTGEGYELYILSTNSKDVISSFLAKHELENNFSAIYADIGISGKAKVLKKLMKEHGVNRDDAVYVGDEVRDIEAAHKAGIRCISVSWGYSSEESLIAHKPDFIASSAPEIEKYVH